MTDDEWRACASPARMRGGIRGRPFSGLRWVLFDLACIERVRALLGARTGRWVDELAGWTDPALRAVSSLAPRTMTALREELQQVCSSRTDPLRGARSAAARAVLSLGSYTLATSDMVCIAAGRVAPPTARQDAADAERRVQAGLMRCVFRSTLEPVTFPAAWRTDTAVAIAEQMRQLRDYSALPILADALQEVGCDDERILSHCRCDGPHVRGCWVVDLVLA
jgi:hypothetical protein